MGLYTVGEPYPTAVDVFIEMRNIDPHSDGFSVMGADKGYKIDYRLDDGTDNVLYLGEATDHGRTYVYFNRDIHAPIYLGFSSSNLDFDCYAECDELWSFSGIRYLFADTYNLPLDDHSLEFATELMLSQIREQNMQFCFVRSAFEYMKNRRFYPFSMFGEDPPGEKHIKWLN